MEDKFFRYAVAVSLAIHLAFFLHFYIVHKDLVFWKKPEAVVYNFVKPKLRSEPKPLERRIEKASADVMEKIDESLQAPERVKAQASPASGDQPFTPQIPRILDNADILDRKPERLKGVKVTKEVSVPMLKSEKINTPSYVTYYQIVRDRIRERAYSNYTKLSVGEVFVTFIIKSDGTLSGLQVLDGKSAANEFLRDVGVKSVREAAPFPAFPKDLVYPELTFNVSISFQYREE